MSRLLRKQPEGIQLLVDKQIGRHTSFGLYEGVDEGRGGGGTNWLTVVGDGCKWAVVQAVAFRQGEIKDEIVLAIEKLEGARTVVLEAFLTPRGKHRAGFQDFLRQHKTVGCLLVDQEKLMLGGSVFP